MRFHSVLTAFLVAVTLASASLTDVETNALDASAERPKRHLRREAETLGADHDAADVSAVQRTRLMSPSRSPTASGKAAKRSRTAATRMPRQSASVLEAGVVRAEQGSQSTEGLESATSGIRCSEENECKELGCFPRQPDDIASLVERSQSSLDFSCAVYTPNPGPCRSGLPFYSFTSNDMSPLECFNFCLSKGLDVAGLVDGTECRCGATTRLFGVWDGKAPPQHLLFEHMLDKKVAEDDVGCKIVAYMYTGSMVNGLPERSRAGFTPADQRYVQSIVDQDDTGTRLWDHAAASAYMENLFWAQRNANLLLGQNQSNSSVDAAAGPAAPAAPVAPAAPAATAGVGKAAGKAAAVPAVTATPAPPHPHWAGGLAEGARQQREVSRDSLQSNVDESIFRFPEDEDPEFLPICTPLTEDGDCSEAACRCETGSVKETMMLSTGATCWACAAHCNSNERGCGTLPCRCDAKNFEVAIAWNTANAADTNISSTTDENSSSDNAACIRCVDGHENGLTQPWPRFQKADDNIKAVLIPYLVEEDSSYALNKPRIDVVQQVLQDFETNLPCIRFVRIDWATKQTNVFYKEGHFVHVMAPPKTQNWCLGQNSGCRRRQTQTELLSSRRRMSAKESDAEYLRSARSDGWNGPSLLWVGHCNTARWAPRLAQEVGKILGMHGEAQRIDALVAWHDPWSAVPGLGVGGQHHGAHIEVFWDNVANESAKARFLPRDEAYTGSYASSIEDPFAGYAEYDFFSIMHPDPMASSKGGLKNGQPTFTTLPNGNWDKVAGSASQLSLGDITMLGDLYKCNSDRFFAEQSYKRGLSVTTLQYTRGLSHTIASDIASTQEWIISKDQAEIEEWIRNKIHEQMWQLSFIRYMPSDNAFAAYVDTNRWSRRRSSGAAEQRYHWGRSFSTFKDWVKTGHRERYFVTDMATAGQYVTGIMTKMDPSTPILQSLVWSGNWSSCVEQIKAQSLINPDFAVTHVIQNSYWDDLGWGCCKGEEEDRKKNLMYIGSHMTSEECKQKCEEYATCGAIDVNTTGHCHVFSWDFDCNELDYTSCERHGSVSWGLPKLYTGGTEVLNDKQRLPVDHACLGMAAGGDEVWYGSEKTARAKCLMDASCMGVFKDGRDHYYCQTRPSRLSDGSTWMPKGMPMNLSAHSHSTEWVIAMTTNTGIHHQLIKVSETQQEAMRFINTALSNETHPRRITTNLATHWGGFVTVMSMTAPDSGAPYWSPPIERLQRYGLNQPYAGYI